VLKNIYNALEKPHLSRFGYLTQKVILFNILLNVFSFLATTLFNIEMKFENILNLIENLTVVFFIIELVTRYIVIGQDSQYRGLIGRIKYTFTFYTMIDIISIIPYFIASISADIIILRVIRFFRFFRILKLLRIKKFAKKFLSINSFASSTIAMQVIVLFILSTLTIFIFSYAYHSTNTSISIFLSPSSIIESKTIFETLIGIIELLIGLVIGGALISIITSTLVNITGAINKGYLPYKGKDHIVIINKNSYLDFVLHETDQYYQDKSLEQDIVIFLPHIETIESFKKNLKKYSSLNIAVVAGDPLNWNSYERININGAKKVLLLLSDSTAVSSLNKKITRFILTHNNFENKNLEFTIETNNNFHAKNIYEYMFHNLENKYSIINRKELIGKLLNRAVVNHDYFKIFSELLSFDGHEFYTLDARDIFDQEIQFSTANLQFTDGVLLGIIHNNELLLNPSSDMMIASHDKLVVILEHIYSYTIDTSYSLISTKEIINKPDVKETKNICIVGDYSDISIDDITQFLTQESIHNLEHIIASDGDYMNESIWSRLLTSDTDVIILNLEDEYEFVLSLYLQGFYSDNKIFLSKIINILHDPINAMLLLGKEQESNIILSEKLIGEYIAQVLFNSNIVDIFNEITHADGNEMYILNFDKYSMLFNLDYNNLKSTLINNNMIYIGVIIDDKLVFDCKDIKESKKIVVLTEGQ